MHSVVFCDLHPHHNCGVCFLPAKVEEITGAADKLRAEDAAGNRTKGMGTGEVEEPTSHAPPTVKSVRDGVVCYLCCPL